MSEAIQVGNGPGLTEEQAKQIEHKRWWAEVQSKHRWKGRGFPISTHLHHRQFSVAMTDNFDLPLRKWWFVRGGVYAVSGLSAVYASHQGHGDIVESRAKDSGMAHRFEDGSWVYVGY